MSLRGAGYGFAPRILPVLAASRTFVDEQAEIAVERLRRVGWARWTRLFDAFETHTLGLTATSIGRPRGPVVQRASDSAAAA